MVAKSQFHLSFWMAMHRRLLQSCAIGSLAVLTLISPALRPTLFGQSDRVMAQEADQQILSNDDLFTLYVRAAWDIERERRQMMGEVKQLTGGSVPDNVCGNLEKVAPAQRGSIQSICQDFAQFASSTVAQKYKLSPQQFNAFQRRVGDAEMRQRINQKMQQLQLR